MIMKILSVGTSTVLQMRGLINLEETGMPDNWQQQLYKRSVRFTI